jgi:hypothetical protein
MGEYLKGYDVGFAAGRLAADLEGGALLQRTIQNIEAEARRYAEMYPQSSDGRNTFIIFADWIASSSVTRLGREGDQ